MMKSFKLILLAISVSLVFNSCKKDEETPSGSTALPEGNYVKFQGVTYLEKDWVAAEIWTELGNRPNIKISFNETKTKNFGLAFQDELQEKTYTLSSQWDGTNNAIASFRENANNGERYVVDNNSGGTVVVNMVNGEMVVEVHGKMAESSPGKVAGGQIDARFVWKK